MKRPPTTVQTIDLSCDQMLVLHDRHGSCVGVLYDGRWLTPLDAPATCALADGLATRGGVAGAPTRAARLGALLNRLATLARSAAALLRGHEQAPRVALDPERPAAT